MLRENELNFVLDDDIQTFIKAIEKMCRSGIGGVTDDIMVRCHTKDKRYRWLLLTGQLFAQHINTFVIHIVMMDITKRKEAEDRQRISEELFRIAMETDKRAIVIYNVKDNTCHVESHTLYSARFGDTFSNIPESLIDTGVVSTETADELFCFLIAFEKVNQT